MLCPPLLPTCLTNKLHTIACFCMGDFKTVAENLARHKNGTYYLQAKIAGKKIRKSLRTDALRIAKIKRNDLLAKLRMQSGLARDYENMTIGQLIAVTRSYYADIPSYREKPASLHYRNQILDVLASQMPVTRAISTLSKSETVDLFKYIAGRYSPQRYNNTLGTFRKMMEIAIKKAHACIDDPSMEIERLAIRKKEITVPTASEFKAIIKAVRGQKKANSLQASQFIEFLAYAGCRVDESRHIKGHDIAGSRIRITGGVSGTKNHEARFVPIVPAMRELLERIDPEPNKPLFSLKSPREALKNACLRLGIRHVRVHDLRHFFATTCIESGIDFATIAKWLGHKDGGILVAKTYGHIRDDHSQREAAKVQF